MPFLFASYARVTPRTEQPALAIGTCELPACVSSFTGLWLDGYGPCSATCGKGVQSFAPTCSTGNEKDCDPKGEWHRHMRRSGCSDAAPAQRPLALLPSSDSQISFACFRVRVRVTASTAFPSPSPSPSAAKPDGLPRSCTPALPPCAYTGSWIPGFLRACSTYVCGQTGTAAREFKCSTGNDADCDPNSQWAQ